MDSDCREPLGMAAQNRLDEFLRYAMRQLGGAPGAGETLDQVGSRAPEGGKRKRASS